MTKLPERISSLHEGEESLFEKSGQFLESDDHMAWHMELLEASMDLLSVISTGIQPDDDEDHKVVCLLGMRAFNDCGAAFRLATGGYYQAAILPMRDLLELAFLFGWFGHDQAKITEWRTGDEKTHRRIFSPSNVRKIINRLDGFTGKRRDAVYKMMSELGGHPTPAGLSLLVPSGHTAHGGPFFDVPHLEHIIEELARTASQAAMGIATVSRRRMVKPELAARIRFYEVSGKWLERYYGHPYDSAKIDEVRELFRQLG